jgi:hypothetical protein
MGGAITVTVNVRLVLVPQLSEAVLVTVVTPIGNTLPLAGMEIAFGELQPPLALTEKETFVPLVPVAATIMFVGQTRLMGGATTVTVNVQLVDAPQLSNAVLVTVVTPIGKTLPVVGDEMTVGGLQPPVAVGVKETAAPLELVAVTVILAGQVSTIGLVTVMLKVELVEEPQLSKAALVTMVMPIGKMLPLAGTEVTVGRLQPPLALTEKNTVAPLELVITVMLVGEFKAMGMPSGLSKKAS